MSGRNEAPELGSECHIFLVIFHAYTLDGYKPYA
jgi:hypothetical protein